MRLSEIVGSGGVLLALFTFFKKTHVAGLLSCGRRRGEKMCLPPRNGVIYGARRPPGRTRTTGNIGH